MLVKTDARSPAIKTSRPFHQRSLSILEIPILNSWTIQILTPWVYLESMLSHRHVTRNQIKTKLNSLN